MVKPCFQWLVLYNFFSIRLSIIICYYVHHTIYRKFPYIINQHTTNHKKQNAPKCYWLLYTVVSCMLIASRLLFIAMRSWLVKWLLNNEYVKKINNYKKTMNKKTMFEKRIGTRLFNFTLQGKKHWQIP